MRRHTLPTLLATLALAQPGCSIGAIMARNASVLVSEPQPAPQQIAQPVRADARLAVSWVGHATMLIQLDDRVILTDPVFTETVGQISRRLVQAGLAPERVPPVDAVLISHMHFDHLSTGSIDLVEDKVKKLFLPSGGLTYLPNYRFPAEEVRWWEPVTWRGLEITAVPVDHVGFRYGVDRDWTAESFTGWVIEYHGLTVYFGGDTAYDPALFRATAARFPRIDVAILPIGPIEPAEFMRKTHVDPAEAVQVFQDLGAEHMIPMHYDTFPHGLDEPGDAVRALRSAMLHAGLGEDRVHVLPIGGQVVLVPAGPVASGTE